MTVGVESAVPLVAFFLAFFFRPTIGACSGLSAKTAIGGSWDFEASSTNLARACLSFFCWLLDICRTGAEPILVGGGVFARDIEAEVKDALSDILSLTGVPGKCTDAKLPRREGSLLATVGVDTFTLDGEDDGTRGGGSAMGVGRTRSVRECCGRATDDPDA